MLPSSNTFYNAMHVKSVTLRILETPLVSQNKHRYRFYMLLHKFYGAALGAPAGEGTMEVEY
jgi:hypothetical protein